MAQNELIGFGLLILAALTGAVYATVIKLSADRVVLMAGLNLITVMIGLVLLPFGVTVDVQAIPYLLGAGVLYNIMLFWLIKGYAHNDLSRVIPIVGGMRVAVVTALTLMLTTEAASPIQMLAVLFLLTGFAVQIPLRDLADPHNRAAIGYCFITGFISGGQFYLDFQGVKISGNPYGFIVLTLFYGLPIALYGLWTRRKSMRAVFESEGRRMVAGAILDIVSYSLLLYAVYGLKVLHALPASNLTMVFTTMIGLWFLKEQFARRRLIAAFLIFISVVIMQVAIAA